MGNCFAMPASLARSLSSSTSCCSASWRSSESLCSNLSCDSRAGGDLYLHAPTHSNINYTARRVLPFPTPRDLGAHYQVGRELGRGQFGVIRLCTCLASGTLYACKSISKLREQELPDILREVRVMQRLSASCSSAPRPPAAQLHNNIVGLHQVIEDDFFVHLIMELCHGGELFDRIVKKRYYPEREAASIIQLLMQSIQFCHSMGVMHRDVKPENVLLVHDSDSSAIKLADFGLALEFSPGQKFFGMAGSAYYIAPEVLEGEYSQEIDVWSTGVVLYVMLSGVPPFWGETDQDIFDAIREGNLEFTGSFWETISFSAKDLIRGMLCVDVKARLTPAQVLEHPWILHHSKALEEQGLHQNQDTVRSSHGVPTSSACTDAQKRDGGPASQVPACLSYDKEQVSLLADSFTQHTTAVLASTCPANNHQISVACMVSSSNDSNQAVNVSPIMEKHVEIGKEILLAAFVAQLKDTHLPPLETLLAQAVSLQESDWSYVCKVEKIIFAQLAGKRKFLISNMEKRKKRDVTN